VVVAWTNWSRGRAERRLEGGGICRDAGSIAVAWGRRDRYRWPEVREEVPGVFMGGGGLACARG
jgi:hypothetical protein